MTDGGLRQRKDEAAGALNHITPEGAARALEALQFVALNESCAAAAASKSGALESVVGIVAACNGAPASSRASKEELIEDIKLSFAKYDFAGRGTLNAKEFDEWFVARSVAQSRSTHHPPLPTYSLLRRPDGMGAGRP